MVPKLLFLTAMFFSWQHGNAQPAEPHFSIGAESQFLLAGELNASYDFLLGARGYYFLQSRRGLQPFFSIGLATDIGTTPSLFFSADAQIGIRWDFSKRFLYLSLMLTYLSIRRSN